MDEQQLLLACKLRDEGNFRAAIEKFTELLTQVADPLDKAGVLIHLAVAFKNAKEFDRARKELKTVNSIVRDLLAGNKELESDERVVWLRISSALEDADISYDAGNSEEALTKFNGIESQFGIELRKTIFRMDYQLLRTRRALLLADLGRWKDSLPLLQEAESFEEEKAVIRFYLGQSYVATDENAMGKEKLTEALKMRLPPDLEFRAHCMLGRAFYKLEAYTEAQIEFEKCAQTADPAYIRKARLWEWLQATCAKLGLKDKAERYAQMARPAN